MIHCDYTRNFVAAFPDCRLIIGRLLCCNGRSSTTIKCLYLVRKLPGWFLGTGRVRVHLCMVKATNPTSRPWRTRSSNPKTKSNPNPEKTDSKDPMSGIQSKPWKPNVQYLWLEKSLILIKTARDKKIDPLREERVCCSIAKSSNYLWTSHTLQFFDIR